MRTIPYQDLLIQQEHHFLNY